MNEIRQPPMNPLLADLEAVSRANVMAGRGGSTVMPPPPIPLGETDGTPQAPDRPHGPSMETAASPAFEAVGPIREFVAIDLHHGQIIADNGQLFPIEQAEVERLRAFCFTQARQAEERRWDQLKLSMGIPDMKPEKKPTSEKSSRGTPTSAG